MVVVALPRGGVPVAYEVGRALRSPVDIIVVRKIGAPGHPELACGAISSGGVTIWNNGVLRALGLSKSDLDQTIRDEEFELRRRESLLRTDQTPPIDVAGTSVVLVDDGIATGASLKAALDALKLKSASEIVIALPVGPDETCRKFEDNGFSVVCPLRVAKGQFSSVGEWYDDFSQVSTSECRDLLLQSRATRSSGYAQAF